MKAILVAAAFIAAPAFSETLFDSTAHCVRDSGVYMACAAKTQDLQGTIQPDSTLPILEDLPQVWRLGYRFYCSSVIGGELQATLKYEDKSIGLNRTKEPLQQGLTLYLAPGANPVLDVATTKKATRISGDCKFEVTSVSNFPLTKTLNEVADLIQTQKNTRDYLCKNENLVRSLGFLDASKTTWTSKIKGQQTVIDSLQKIINNPATDPQRIPGLEAKIAEANKTKGLYETELQAVEVYLDAQALPELKKFAIKLNDDVASKEKALLDYLNAFSIQQGEDEVVDRIHLTATIQTQKCEFKP